MKCIFIIGISIIVLLTGCITPYHKPGATKLDLKRDRFGCKMQCRQYVAPTYDTYNSRPATKYDSMQRFGKELNRMGEEINCISSCMESKGWER